MRNIVKQTNGETALRKIINPIVDNKLNEVIQKAVKEIRLILFDNYDIKQLKWNLLALLSRRFAHHEPDAYLHKFSEEEMKRRQPGRRQFSPSTYRKVHNLWGLNRAAVCLKAYPRELRKDIIKQLFQAVPAYAKECRKEQAMEKACDSFTNFLNNHNIDEIKGMIVLLKSRGYINRDWRRHKK